MAEGRCYLSSYMTGESPNTVGACSPAKFVRWEETPNGLESRLNEVLIDRYGEKRVQQGGFKVYTTIDPRFQRAAQFRPNWSDRSRGRDLLVSTMDQMRPAKPE